MLGQPSPRPRAAWIWREICSDQAVSRSSWIHGKTNSSGCGAVGGPEAADLAKDGRPVPAAPLQVVETTGQMPGHPEADELGAFEGILGDGVTDLRIEVLHAPGGGGEGLGDDVLVEVVVVPGPAVHGYPAAFGALALVAAEVKVFTHGPEYVAWLRQDPPQKVKLQVGRPSGGRGHV